ncbi:hypothetical protein LMG28614_07154 [Paraburkholderia ultramafica]|uniref:OmpR/PhoB-type domain-containing protein n=1 Tax=Paraburkholderia ultramafica TaxID=1544867 RepID=A0A6S7BRV4_9BURK|nr:winged helix-turn-helix domain-containing protein [Paraburkholderia ultramafica]CAB3809859.1 hypothetical protein LMG28614_07154 [Paraburkholderia ultramafica]
MLTIGNVEILTDERRVLVSGRPFDLGPKAFDLLELLANARGGLVTKDEIMRRVWPNTVVIENNIHVQIATIRKVLGRDSDRLVVVPRRGYRLAVENDESVQLNDHATTVAAPTARKSNLPLTRIPAFGRDESIREVVNLCGESTLVNLVGPGGIGKTTLAIEAAHCLKRTFSGGVWLVELSRVTVPQFVQAAVADALGCEAGPVGTAMERVLASLRGKNALVVLDNCEHVIHAAADIAQVILSSAPTCAVMATSRERLKVPGEIVYRVPSLDVPLADDGDQDPARTSAVQLFLSRARAIDRQFGSSPGTVAIAGGICRRLDGIPLAIELAASRAVALGIQELAADLDNRYCFLTAGDRTAVPRHQTLKATFDWSHSLLSAKEQAVLRRLAVFPSFFGLQAAIAVVGAEDVDETEILDGMCVLCEKSLLIAENSGAATRYRLLGSGRAYALQALRDNGELETFEHRFIEFVRRVLQRTLFMSHMYTDENALADFKSQLDDVRSALHLVFYSHRNRVLGLELLAATVPFFCALGLSQEVRKYAQLALTTWSDGRVDETASGLTETVRASDDEQSPTDPFVKHVVSLIAQ